MGEKEPLSVLVVDDDEVDREAVHRALRDLPLTVADASNGNDALAMLRGSVKNPRVVLADINMPMMDGFELIDAIRADESLASTVVFILTSSSRETDQVKAYSRNVAGYMVKGELGSRMGHLSSLLSAYAAAIRLPL